MNAETQINFHHDTMETGNVVALPIDDTSEHSLLAGLLNYSGGTASATAPAQGTPTVECRQTV